MFVKEAGLVASPQPTVLTLAPLPRLCAQLHCNSLQGTQKMNVTQVTQSRRDNFEHFNLLDFHAEWQTLLMKYSPNPIHPDAALP